MMLQDILMQMEQPNPANLSQTAIKLKPKPLQKNGAELRKKLVTAERTIATLQMELHALRKSYHLLEALHTEQSKAIEPNQNSQASYE